MRIPRLHLPRLGRGFTPTRRAMLNTAGVLMALAAVQPEIPVLQPVHSFLMVVDISRSMYVRDMRVDGELTSRAAAIQRRIAETVRALPCGTEVGLGVFAGYQTMVMFQPVEVCEYYNELEKSASGISPDTIWATDSEIAKGIYNAIGFIDGASSGTQLVFLTDGQEAPPVSARYRPQFRGTVGAVKGWLVGVGEPTLSPIPKLDERGRQIGVWQAQEVAQSDPYTSGRSTTGGGEKMADADAGKVSSDVTLRLQAQPGREHLSQLRESYLKLLAEELEFGYTRLGTGSGLADQLIGGPASTWRWVKTPISPALGVLALICLIMAYWRSNLSPLDWTRYWLGWPLRQWRQQRLRRRPV
jgi:mxaL protein